MVETEQDRLNIISDWGADITLPGGAVIKGIVDREFAALSMADVGFESTDPQFVGSTAQTAALSEGSAVEVANSGISGVDGNYKVKEVQPDGTGLSVVRLVEA